MQQVSLVMLELGRDRPGFGDAARELEPRRQVVAMSAGTRRQRTAMLR